MSNRDSGFKSHRDISNKPSFRTGTVRKQFKPAQRKPTQKFSQKQAGKPVGRNVFNPAARNAKNVERKKELKSKKEKTTRPKVTSDKNSPKKER